MMETLSQHDEIFLRRYLLGHVSPDEQSAIEQRLLTDEDYFNCLLKAEEDLIDEYARGEVRGREAKEFESRFLHDSDRRESVEFAKAFHRYLVKQGGQEVSVARAIHAPRWRIAMEVGLICAGIALAALSISLFRKMASLREQVAQSQMHGLKAEHRAGELAQQIKREQEQMADLRREVEKLKSTGSRAAAVASLVLVPGLARNSDQAASANISSRTRALRLVLQLDDGGYRSYRAELQTVEGTVVWSQDSLTPHSGRQLSREIRLLVPGRLLVRSDYLVVLSSAGGKGESLATYYFHVARKEAAAKH